MVDVWASYYAVGIQSVTRHSPGLHGVYSLVDEFSVEHLNLQDTNNI